MSRGSVHFSAPVTGYTYYSVTPQACVGTCVVPCGEGSLGTMHTGGRFPSGQLSKGEGSPDCCVTTHPGYVHMSVCGHIRPGQGEGSPAGVTHLYPATLCSIGYGWNCEPFTHVCPRGVCPIMCGVSMCLV